MKDFREKIKHLNEEEKEALISEYYGKELSNTKLMKKYEIKKVRAGDLYKCFPGTISDRSCQYCSTKMLLSPKPNTIAAVNEYECLNCGHISDGSEYSSCGCQNCMKKREQKLKREKELQEEQARIEIEKVKLKQAKLYEIYSNHEVNITNLNDIEIIDYINLAAFLDCYLSEDNYNTHPIIRTNEKLMIDSNESFEIIKDLLHKGYIGISELSPLEAFSEFEPEDIPETIYLDQVVFYPTVDIQDDSILKSLISGDLDLYLKNRSDDERATIINVIYSLWKTIAHEECMELLLHQLSKVHLEFNPGKKTIDMLDYFLDSLSVSEIYSVIYSGITYACRVIKEKGITGTYAPNLAINIIRSNGDKVITGEWERRKYKRARSLEQSGISKYLFYRLLKIGDKGFTEKPDVGIIKDLFIREPDSLVNSYETNEE